MRLQWPFPSTVHADDQLALAAFIRYSWEAASNGASWAKEHPAYAEHSNFASMECEGIKRCFTGASLVAVPLPSPRSRLAGSRATLAAFIRYSWEAASNSAIWAEEHQEKYKNPYLVWAACVVLALILYALVRGIEALLGVIFKLVIVVLKLPYRFVMLFIKLILRSEYCPTELASTSLNTLALQSSPHHLIDLILLRLHLLGCQVAYVGSHARFSRVC